MATLFGSMFDGAALARAINVTELALSGARDGLTKVVVTILTWQARAEQRHQLSSMDDRLLRDMGLTRGDVTREVSKRVWEG